MTWEPDFLWSQEASRWIYALEITWASTTAGPSQREWYQRGFASGLQVIAIHAKRNDSRNDWGTTFFTKPPCFFRGCGAPSELEMIWEKHHWRWEGCLRLVISGRLLKGSVVFVGNAERVGLEKLIASVRVHECINFVAFFFFDDLLVGTLR